MSRPKCLCFYLREAIEVLSLELPVRTASDDPVAHRPSQDSRTSSLVDSKESKGSGSVRTSSKLSRDSHPRAPRQLRDIVRPTTPMESDLIVLGSEAAPW